MTSAESQLLQMVQNIELKDLEPEGGQGKNRSVLSRRFELEETGKSSTLVHVWFWNTHASLKICLRHVSAAVCVCVCGRFVRG